MYKKFNLKNMCSMLLLAAVALTSCSKQAQQNNSSAIGGKYKTPKYVFLFIGDGMAMPHITLTEAALKQTAFRANYELQTGSPAPDSLRMCRLPIVGMATTNAEDRYITDSAAAATALSTGHKTSVGTLGMNGDHTKNLKSIAEMAHEKGMKVGIITTVSMDHATPAGFYAHTGSRSSYSIISHQLLGSGFDYFGGGSIRWDALENSDLVAYKKAAADSSFHYITNKKDFEALTNKSGKIITTIPYFDSCHYDDCALPYSIDLDMMSEDNRLTLADFTRKGIEVLDNPNGFFMMVEGGKIDWANHANDVVSAIYEVIGYDKAIGEALEFYKKHPDETLIVVTADHECGGLTLGFAGTNYESAFNMLSKQDISFKRFTDEVHSWRNDKTMTFEKALVEIHNHFGLDDDSLGTKLSDYEKSRLKTAYMASMSGKCNLPAEEKMLYYGSYDPLTVTVTHILNNKAGVDYSTYSHTALPVPVFSIGQGSTAFNEYYDNTDIPKRIMAIAGFSGEQ